MVTPPDSDGAHPLEVAAVVCVPYAAQALILGEHLEQPHLGRILLESHHLGLQRRVEELHLLRRQTHQMKRRLERVELEARREERLATAREQGSSVASVDVTRFGLCVCVCVVACVYIVAA